MRTRVRVRVRVRARVVHTTWCKYGYYYYVQARRLQIRRCSPNQRRHLQTKIPTANTTQTIAHAMHTPSTNKLNVIFEQAK